MKEKNTSYIIFYDGPCSFCNALVRFVIRRDRNRHFLFTPLQGETAQRLIPNNSFDSIVLWDKGKVTYKSGAVFKICSILGFPLSVLSIFKILPRFITDRCYDFIAKRRHLILRNNEACSLEDDGFSDRILQ